MPKSTRTGATPRSRTPKSRLQSGTPTSQPAQSPSPYGRDARGGRGNSTLWRGPWPIVGAVLGIVGAVVVFLLLSQRPTQQPAQPGFRSSTGAVAAKTTSIPRSVSDSVAGGGVSNPLTPIRPPVAVLRSSSGKPEVLYIGAEYCPYCAAERWALVAALGRFGRFKNLRLIQSSNSDAYPNTPTFSFVGATYTSDVIAFRSVELQSRNHEALQTPTEYEQKLLAAYDAQRSIPFIDFGNTYYEVGASYFPDVLAGKTWDDVASALRDPSAPSTRDIVGSANYFTAAICTLTAGNPASACSDPTITKLQASLSH